MEFRLWEDTPPLWREDAAVEFNANACTIEPYLLDEKAGVRPAFLCLAGGAYTGRADHECYDIARWMNSIGLHGFVLNYRVAPYRYPAALLDAQRAMRVIRSRAAEWRVDASRIGVIGFSAGGHLAATLSTKWDKHEEFKADAVDELDAKPNLSVLAYAVTSFVHEYHGGSMQALLGEEPSRTTREDLSASQHVNADTPPAFVWTTADDDVVPASNTMRYFSALREAGVASELHVFESGPHGLGLASDHPECKAWPSLCEAWLQRQGW